MTLPVHLVPSLVGVAVGDEASVEGDEAHHAVAVRRLRVGEAVVLTDGVGGVATAEVLATDRRRLAVRVTGLRAEPPPQPEVVVVQALPKGDRGELAVELLTEVGVGRIVPWPAARSVVSWRGERAAKALRRWRATAREAAKQSRRAWHPVVDDPASTGEVCELVGAAGLAVVLHESADRPLAWLDVPRVGRLVVVVGPEGGLTEEEVAGFAAAGGEVVRLGSEVLRTSTAGVAAVAALLSRTPRWL